MFCAQPKVSSRDCLQISIPHSSKVSRIAVMRKEISFGNSFDLNWKIWGRIEVFGVKDVKLLVSKPKVVKRSCHFKSASDGSIIPPGNTYVLGKNFEFWWRFRHNRL